MKKLIEEFKAFIMRGNVLDMAVGVIIATAFGKITTTLINNILMPFIGYLLNSPDTTGLNVIIREAQSHLAEDGTEVIDKAAIVLGFGDFVGAIIEFILIAFVVFLIVRAFNKAHELAEKKKHANDAPAEPAAPTTKKCPFCCSEIAIEATRCPHCTSELPEEK